MRSDAGYAHSTTTIVCQPPTVSLLSPERCRLRSAHVHRTLSFQLRESVTSSTRSMTRRMSEIDAAVRPAIALLDCRQDPMQAGRMKSQKHCRPINQVPVEHRQSHWYWSISRCHCLLPRIRKLRMRSSVMMKFVTLVLRSSKVDGATVADDWSINVFSVSLHRNIIVWFSIRLGSGTKGPTWPSRVNSPSLVRYLHFRHS